MMVAVTLGTKTQQAGTLLKQLSHSIYKAIGVNECP